MAAPASRCLLPHPRVSPHGPHERIASPETPWPDLVCEVQCRSSSTGETRLQIAAVGVWREGQQPQAVARARTHCQCALRRRVWCRRTRCVACVGLWPLVRVSHAPPRDRRSPAKPSTVSLTFQAPTKQRCCQENGFLRLRRLGRQPRTGGTGPVAAVAPVGPGFPH